MPDYTLMQNSSFNSTKRVPRAKKENKVLKLNPDFKTGPRSIFDSRRRVPMVFSGPGRAKQAMKNETDINNIMKRYQTTGVVDFVNKQKGTYADVRNMDFDASMNSLVRAQNMFADLPSKIRKRFANSPAEFLDFMNDSANTDEAIALGLLPALHEPETGEPVLPHTRRKSDAPEEQRPHLTHLMSNALGDTVTKESVQCEALS